MKQPQFADASEIRPLGRVGHPPVTLNLRNAVFNDTYADPKIIGEDDYESVVRFISEAKCRQAKDYEAEFHEPATFPRPKNFH